MVETLEASVVWELPRVEVEKLIDQYHDIERLYRGFIEHSLIESQVKADALRFEPAHERYNKLLQLHPEILKRACVHRFLITDDSRNLEPCPFFLALELINQS